MLRLDCVSNKEYHRMARVLRSAVANCWPFCLCLILGGLQGVVEARTTEQFLGMLYTAEGNPRLRLYFQICHGLLSMVWQSTQGPSASLRQISKRVDVTDVLPGLIRYMPYTASTARNFRRRSSSNCACSLLRASSSSALLTPLALCLSSYRARLFIMRSTISPALTCWKS